MDRQQISLKLVLDAVGEPLDLSAFDKRLILQKTIYLLQAARVDLGYSFNWYLKGPYSLLSPVMLLLYGQRFLRTSTS